MRRATRGVIARWLAGAALLAVAILAACSRQSPSAESQQTPSSPAATSQPATAAPSAAAAFNGTWSGETGEIKLWALDAGKVQTEFNGRYEYDTADGTMVNVGMATGVASVEGDTAILRPLAGGDCAITMRATADRLDVTEAGVCGFGLNVTSEGAYRRSSTGQPKFGG